MTESSPTLVIVGVGLIGGSIGLGLRRAGWEGRIRGLDRPDVLEQALAAGAIDESAHELAPALAGADIVVLATPVATIIELLPRVAALAPARTLLTDTGSTKQRICVAAAAGGAVERRFLGGHPIAGREEGGLAHADPLLFSGHPWILVPTPAPAAGMQGTEALAALADRSPNHRRWLEALSRLGAMPRVMDAADHDETMAWVSHVPQLLATALGAALARAFADPGARTAALACCGPGLRDMLRLAMSPYALWRDILLTNSEPVESALAALQQDLDHLRLNLRTRALAAAFDEARGVAAQVRARVPKSGESAS